MNERVSGAALALLLASCAWVSGSLAARAAGPRILGSPKRTLYISPIGDDTADGTSEATAWQTWPFAMAQLQPGDLLIVGNGTWTNGNVEFATDPKPVLRNARLPAVDCDPAAINVEYRWPYRNGTETAPIVIRARNERGTLLRSNGRAAAISMRSCRHWSLVGLRMESADLPREPNNGTAWSVVDIAGSQNIRLERLLARRNNRYHNCHVLRLVRCQKCTLLENEVYEFHRHGIRISHSDAIEVTRCFAHSRGWRDICGGYDSHDVARCSGDEGLVCYYSNHCLIQNVIVGDCEGIQVTGDHNRVLGCIAVDSQFGFRFASNCQDSGEQICRIDPANPLLDTYAVGNHGENLIAVDCSIAGVDCDSSKDTTLRHITMVGCRTLGFWGRDRKETTGFDTSFQLDYALALGFGGRVGIAAEIEVTGPWSGKHLNAFGHALNEFGPSASAGYGNQYGKWEYAMSIDPQLGANLVHVPKSSPMWLPDGKCIGANVLYRYEAGVLTAVQLWSTPSGAFPHGAVIDRVNDPSAGPCAADVHVRLRVNSQGGALPTSYF